MPCPQPKSRTRRPASGPRLGQRGTYPGLMVQPGGIVEAEVSGIAKGCGTIAGLAVVEDTFTLQAILGTHGIPLTNPRTIIGRPERWFFKAEGVSNECTVIIAIVCPVLRCQVLVGTHGIASLSQSAFPPTAIEGIPCVHW